MSKATKSPGSTPGPWRVIDRGAKGTAEYRYRVMGADDGYESRVTAPPVVAECPIGEDAALIAQAPDLLREVDELRAALLSVVKQAERNGFHEAEGDDGYDFRDALDAARAALAAGGAK